jgi:hypothetical protein
VSLFYKLILLVVLATGAQVSFSETAKFPQFKRHESYTSVRAKMIKSGWKPFYSKGADICAQGDSRCEGRPEMEACAGSGMANCRFLWEKGKKKVAICTVGEDVVYDGICN